MLLILRVTYNGTPAVKTTLNRLRKINREFQWCDLTVESTVLISKWKPGANTDPCGAEISISLHNGSKAAFHREDLRDWQFQNLINKLHEIKEISRVHEVRVFERGYHHYKFKGKKKRKRTGQGVDT